MTGQVSATGPVTEWWIRPVTLEGRVVRVEPLSETHIDALWSIAAHDGIWRWMPVHVTERGHIAAQVERALAWPTREWGQAFVIRHGPSDRICGATAYLNADPHARRVEIGWTWITPEFQRTAVNTETKLVLIRHAFGELGANRVEFKTDSLNERSRSALLRIGATEEGTLRNHMVRPDGSMRHSVYFSIIREEWPGVEEHLEGLLARRD